MLDADPPEQRVELVRYVTGRVDVGRAGPAELVGQDPVLPVDRHVREGGLDADAGHGEVAGDAVTGCGHDGLEPFGPLERGDLRAGPQVDAVRLVEGGDQRADLAAQDPVQRDLAGEDQGDPDPELGQRGRDLAADEPRAHHDRVPTRYRLPLDRVALGLRAQVMEPGQAGSRDREPPVASAGGDQDLGIAEFLARVQGDRVRGGIDGRHDGSMTTVDLVVVVPAAGLTYQPARSSSDRR